MTDVKDGQTVRWTAPSVMLLSVRPPHVDRILDGTKTVELRRTRPSVRPRQPVLLYATQPVGAIVGSCRIGGVRQAASEAMWGDIASSAAVSRGEYDRYLAGRDTVVALFIEDVRPLVAPITLDQMRAAAPFQPPQTWHFLGADRLAQLTAAHPAAAELQALLAAQQGHQIARRAESGMPAVRTLARG
ncbi:MAG TPA: ASCH domain-containing protein [Frankiaceae bacterium]|nr:ASCH domain-containing protein [Frankiaceae bacterium]